HRLNTQNLLPFHIIQGGARPAFSKDTLDISRNDLLHSFLIPINLMLRKRHNEMLALQDAQRSEHQFIASKFTSARDMVQNLTKERNALQVQLQRLLAEEKASVKAQVTSLLGELKESQLSLEASLQERRKLEERCVFRITREQQREWEAQVKQHIVQMDQRRLQVQSLEAALKTERTDVSEAKKRLAQLQAAYHQLFQEYDTHIKKSLQMEKHDLAPQVEDLQQQLQEAEEALVAKQEVIDKLKEEAERTRALLDNVPVLKAQVDIYREDFQAERAAREKLAEDRDKLLEQIEKLQQERPLCSAGSGLVPFHNQLPSGFATMNEPRFCPKCQYKAPDMDTLQIHMMDCIQ
uniref:NF-kappa-B essential modulator n=1 Tax=Leptobrachium leishanense TaxID=445787 RepID=A0A8C5PL73_9ANUR